MFDERNATIGMEGQNILDLFNMNAVINKENSPIPIK
jgi:hypothetical protein